MTQVKMRCLRDHSSLVWGSPSSGEIFFVNPGYVRELVDQGLAVEIKQPVDDVIRELQSTVDQPTTKRRGRPRKAKK